MPWDPCRKALDQPEPWYQGPTLWELMKSFTEPVRKIAAPLRMTISTTVRVRGAGIVLVGRIVTGCLRVNQRVVLTPNLNCLGDNAKTKYAIVRTMEKNHQGIQRAIPGDNGRFAFRQDGDPLTFLLQWESRSSLTRRSSFLPCSTAPIGAWFSVISMTFLPPRSTLILPSWCRIFYAASSC